MRGDTGTIASSSGVTVIGTLEVDNTAPSGAEPDRISNSATVNLRGTLKMTAPSSGATSRAETVGILQVDSGACTVDLTAVGALDCTLTCSDATKGLRRTAGALLNFARTTDGGGGYAKLISTNGYVDSEFLPWATVGSSLAMYDTDGTPDGVVPVVSGGTKTTTSTGSSWHAADHWDPAGVPGSGDDVIIAHDTVVDSGTDGNAKTLKFTAGVTLSKNTTEKITVASGSVWVAGDVSPTIGANLDFAAVEAIFNVETGTANLTVSGVVSGSGGLSKGGAGKLTLSGPNDYTGAVAVGSGMRSPVGPVI